jgi:hypothetical protein
MREESMAICHGFFFGFREFTLDILSSFLCNSIVKTMEIVKGKTGIVRKNPKGHVDN